MTENIVAAWDNEEKTIIRVTYGLTWTWDDYFQADQAAQALLDSVDHRVDLILDMLNTALPADSLSRIPTLIRAGIGLARPNTGIVVLVGTSGYLRTLISAFQKVYPQESRRVFLVETLDEAYALIASKRRNNRQTSSHKPPE